MDDGASHLGPHPIKGFVVRNRGSIWLAFAVMIVAATMMHPTGASLIAMTLIGVLLFIMRWVAHVEGRHPELRED